MTDVYPPIGEQIQLLLSSLPATLPPLNPAPLLPTNVASIIDHTLLAPASTPVDIQRCCKEAVSHEAATVCVNSSMMHIAVESLRGTTVRPICTIGFPFGAGNKESKIQETLTARLQGAQEIDMVQNVGLLRAGKYEEVLDEVTAIAQAAAPAILKVIIETCFLTREEIAISTLIACKAGAAFVKTSTGYGGGGANAEDVRLMYEIASPQGVKVKASGGIRSADKVKEMVLNGASRVGASGTKAIVAEWGTSSAANVSSSIKEVGY
ncbi:hypothetical protein CBS101457_006279 [Exobasidium rhododendri]|nr:hypothetical protein CBS101457_006279 [Exobasidium rhododendri]